MERWIDLWLCAAIPCELLVACWGITKYNNWALWQATYIIQPMQCFTALHQKYILSALYVVQLCILVPLVKCIFFSSNLYIEGCPPTSDEITSIANITMAELAITSPPHAFIMELLVHVTCCLGHSPIYCSHSLLTMQSAKLIVTIPYRCIRRYS